MPKKGKDKKPNSVSNADAAGAMAEFFMQQGWNVTAFPKKDKEKK